MIKDNNRIEVKNLSKRFRASFRSRDSALARFVSLVTGHSTRKELTVLENISFNVEEGEILGVIGRNGSGKSTLLRLIAEVYQPDKGEIHTHGKIVYLTSVNQGSIPKLTMRENIYLMGSVMGLKSRDIKEKFEEIVEFSGLREFIDMKVFQFSSGMLARLNFSIVIHCVKHQNPDILLLDEVLSGAGDDEFQKQASDKIESLIRGGASVVLVSHNEETIIKNCDRAIWLEDSKIVESGDPEIVYRKYLESNQASKDDTNLVNNLIEKYGVLSDMQDRTSIGIILSNLQSILTKNVEGEVVELGCHAGTTSLFIRRMLNFYKSGKHFHVYDSFKGLPGKSIYDKQESAYDKGSCATEQQSLIDNFTSANLRLPTIHKGWFKDIPDKEYPDKIAFAFFDGDFYDSIYDSFLKVYPKLTKGAVVVIHDCEFDQLCDGVTKACEDFLKDKPEFGKMIIKDNLGIVIKL